MSETAILSIMVASLVANGLYTTETAITKAKEIRVSVVGHN